MSQKSIYSKIWLGLKVVASLVVNVYAIIAICLYISISHLVSYYNQTVYPTQASVPNDAIIKVTLNSGQFDEHSTYGSPEKVWQSIFGDSTYSQYSFSEQMAALRNAATDNRVKGVVVQINSYFYNTAQAYELSQALLKIREAKKPVYVYVDGFLLNSALLVASAGTQRFVAPHTFVRPERPNYGAVFKKGFYDKFDIDFIGQRMSLYKDYILKDVKYQVDQDVKSTFDENYAQYQELMNLVARNYNQPVSKFDLSDQDLLNLFQSAQGNLAQAFEKQGWYQKILTPQAFSQYVAQNLGARRGYKNVPNYISLNAYTDAQEHPLFNVDASTDQKHIAYLTLTGDVVRKGFGNGVISLNNTVGYLKDIYYNANNVEALVVRIDSPGGATITGETVRNYLDAIRNKGIPIIVSQGFLAASAGYMISSGGSYIYTTPLTITGSIGVVISDAFNLSRFVGNFKVKADTYGYGYAFGDNNFKIPFFVGGYINPYVNQEKEYFKSAITQGYWQFINQVYQGRKAFFKNVEDVNKIAQGHEWGAVNAMKLGLVDAYGNVQTAIAKARQFIEQDQKDRKTDKYSPGTFKQLSAKQIADLPVIYYNPDYNSPVSSYDLYSGLLSFVNYATGGSISKFATYTNNNLLAPVQPAGSLESIYKGTVYNAQTNGSK